MGNKNIFKCLCHNADNVEVNDRWRIMRTDRRTPQTQFTASLEMDQICFAMTGMQFSTLNTINVKTNKDVALVPTRDAAVRLAMHIKHILY